MPLLANDPVPNDPVPNDLVPNDLVPNDLVPNDLAPNDLAEGPADLQDPLLPPEDDFFTFGTARPYWFFRNAALFDSGIVPELS